MTFVIALGAITYALRVAGLMLAVRAGRIPERWSEVTALLPVALIAAVAVTQTAPDGRPRASLVIAALVGTVAGRRIGFLPAVLSGTVVGAAISTVLG